MGYELGDLIQIEIEDLILDPEEIRLRKKTIGKYLMKIRNGDEIDSPAIVRCKYSDKWHLANGYHRTAAFYFSKHRKLEARPIDIDAVCIWFSDHDNIYSIKDVRLIS